jgi:hypothetical protein
MDWLLGANIEFCQSCLLKSYVPVEVSYID